MKNLLAALFLISFTLFPLLAEDAKQALIVEAPDTWNIEEIAGDTFSGSFVKFEIDGGITQTMFMIGDTEGIWNGQFTGTKEGWTEAISILMKLKKNN